jgi:hypothetical protein
VAGFSQPATREQREKAEWMLAALENGVRNLRSLPPRRHWLAQRWAWTAGYLLWVAATIGLGVAAAVPTLVADPGKLRILLAPLITVLFGAAFPLGTMEFVYRQQRRQHRTVGTEVATDITTLRRRLHDLTTPTG